MESTQENKPAYETPVVTSYTEEELAGMVQAMGNPPIPTPPPVTSI
jgi:hypothetical protein